MPTALLAPLALALLAPPGPPQSVRGDFRGARPIRLESVELATPRALAAQDPARVVVDFDELPAGLALRGLEYAEHFVLKSSGAHLGPAALDSRPGVSALAPDLQVDRGNLLVLQSDKAGEQAVPGTFDTPDDDDDGGTLTFLFERPVLPLSLDLVDLGREGSGARITLVDAADRARVFDVPAGFTGRADLATLTLGARIPQVGAGASAIPSEDAGFEPGDVRELHVHLRGPGAIDALTFTRPEDLLLPGRTYTGFRGSGPHVLADLDGSGLPDLALVTGVPDELRVFLSRGDGTLAPPEVYPLSGRGADVTAADLDGNGALDLVVTNSIFGYLTVFLGDGRGAFGRRSDHVLPMSPLEVESGDLNGDGVPDLVLGPRSQGPELAVLLGRGDGRFRAPVLYEAGLRTIDHLTLADLDRDGHLDVAAEYRDGVLVFRNRGDGRLRNPRSFSTDVRADDVAAGDLDGDGHPELLLVDDADGRVAILRNLGDGTFAAPEHLLGEPTFRSSVHVAEVDGLPGLDVLASTGTGCYLHANAGDGTLLPRRLLTPSILTHLGTADMDGDGDLEVVGSSDEIVVHENLGGGHFDVRDQVATLASTGLAVVDLDGDGVLDVAYTQRGGNDTIAVRRGPGPGLLGATVEEVPVGGRPGDLAWGDLDGDAAPDLVVVSDDDDALGLVFNDGTGALEQLESIPTGRLPTDIVLADLDQDGDLDLAVTISTANEVRTYRNDGAGTLVQSGTNAENRTRGLAAADLDADGLVDLAVGLDGGFSPSRVRILRGTGGGVFVRAALAPGGPSAGHLSAGDLDGDGLPDLAFNHSFDKACSVLSNRGGLDLVRTRRLEVGLTPTDVRWGDLDGDGRPEVVVASRNGGGNLHVFPNDGGGILGAARVFDAPRSEAVVLADMDADGRLDVVTSGNGLALLLNR